MAIRINKVTLQVVPEHLTHDRRLLQIRPGDAASVSCTTGQKTFGKYR